MAENKKSDAAEKIVKAEKAKAKKPKSDKPNIFARIWKAIVKFCKDLRGEIKKIVWPDAKTVLKNTGVVLVVVVLFTIVIYLIDQGLSKSIGLLSDVVSKDTVTEAADETATTAAALDATIAQTEAATEAEIKAEAEETTKAEATEKATTTEAADTEAESTTK